MSGMNEKPKAALALRTKTNLVQLPLKQLKRKISDEKLPPAKRALSDSIKSSLSEPIKTPNATLGLGDTLCKDSPPPKKIEDETRAQKKTTEKTTENSPKIDKAERARLEKEEMKQLMKELPCLSEYYELKEKIGRGTFSTVYKALDIRRDMYDNNDWFSTVLNKPYTGEDKAKHLNDAKVQNEFVALKRVYSTSSPHRIANEIKILQQLKGTACISPLITAFRDGNDTFVVMPYYPHDDFNDAYNTMSCNDIKSYLKSMFTALSQLHDLKIIHKDIKPNNFLYNIKKKVGYLIDFGLAQREEDTKHLEEKPEAADELPLVEPVKGFDTRDPRKQVRANRAGTRGYRAPEVLLRVVHQTTAVDIWSVGIILLSLLTRVFPFFVGYDEADSVVEIANVFGYHTLQKMAFKYNRIVHSNICGLPAEKVPLKKLCAYYNGDELCAWPDADIRAVLNLLEKCLQLDPTERITARDALKHPFLHFD
ncbi:kinase-like domain-containing protein [Sporodiniella umbellata]|nr:kinase-like domain-containing protein [Sporodiniella umbellata]